MKLVKSLLLGSAAGLAAVAGAQAADLPMRRAAPVAAAPAVDFVKVCSTYGSGFFTIPGTETCLRVGGRARADVIYLEPFTRADNAIEFLARGRVQLDARTATSYGLLRTFVRLEITRRANSSSANVAQAFVQFGGLTAGRVTSFFSNADLPTFHYGTVRFDDAPENNVLAYTFQMGGGLSATIALEDGLERRNNNFTAAAGGVGSGTVFVDAAGNVVFQNPFSLQYGGQTVPDIVGNIKAAGAWGTAQLSGAIHQVRDVGLAGGRLNAFNNNQALRPFADTEYGWAVMGTLGINLPALGQGDSLWLAATYSSGAASYSGFAGTTGFGGGVGGTGFQFASGVVDAVINPATGEIDLTDIWTIAGGFNHFWSPQFSTGIFGSYAHVEQAGNTFVAGNNVFAGTTPTLAGGTQGLADFNEWRVGVNTKWLPVSGLQLGLEVIYAETDFRGRVTQAGGVLNPGQRTLIGDVGAIEGRFRVQRDF